MDTNRTGTSNRVHKPILTPLRPGIERMIESLPFQPDNRAEVRSWALALTAAAGAWEIEQAKKKAATRSMLGMARTRRDGSK